jgi:hypothetical protein
LIATAPKIERAKVDPNNIDVDIQSTIEREKALGYKLKRHPIGAKLGPDGHYYKFVKGFSTWIDAAKDAREKGGYLAVITSSEEYVFIAKIAKIDNQSGAGENVWLGGTMFNGNIRWMTKEPHNKGLRHKQYHNRYTHCVLGSLGSLEVGISSAYSTGKNGSGKVNTKGYVIEWDN